MRHLFITISLANTIYLSELTLPSFGNPCNNTFTSPMCFVKDHARIRGFHIHTCLRGATRSKDTTLRNRYIVDPFTVFMRPWKIRSRRWAARLKDEQKSATAWWMGRAWGEDDGAFSNRTPIFFEQQPRLARAQTMHSGFNKTATIRVKTAGLLRRPGEESGQETETQAAGGGGGKCGKRLRQRVVPAREWESGG